MPVSKSRLFYALLSTHTLMVMGTTMCIIYTATVAPLGEPWLYLSILVLFLAYYFYGGVLDMRVYRNDSVVHQRMIAGMSCLQTRYKPTWYLLNANLQTLFAAAGRPAPDVIFERELVEGVYPDGEICRLDWCHPISDTKVPPTSKNAARRDDTATTTSSSSSSKTKSKPPVVIIFHGLTGGSDDSNMHYLTQAIHRIGWHVVIPVRRGCGDEATITVPKFYAYGGIEDTAHVVDYIATKMRGHVILGVGISAGSNILANYLGTLGSRSRIQAAISVANGFCWDKGTRAIREHHPVWDAVMSSIVYHTLFGRHGDIFDKHERHVIEKKNEDRTTVVNGDQQQQSCSTPTSSSSSTSTLTKRRITPASPESPLNHQVSGTTTTSIVDSVLRLKRVGSQREVDEAVSRRLHGFPTLEAFYHHQSCEYRLHNIAVPTIFLNALDDPLAHHLNIPTKALQRNPYTLLVTTACGGHLGWAEGWLPFSNTPSWMDRFVVEGLCTLHDLAEEVQRTGNVQGGSSQQHQQQHFGGNYSFDASTPLHINNNNNRQFHSGSPVWAANSSRSGSTGYYPTQQSTATATTATRSAVAASDDVVLGIPATLSGAALDSLQSSLTTSPAKLATPLNHLVGGSSSFATAAAAANHPHLDDAASMPPMLTFAPTVVTGVVASQGGGSLAAGVSSSESGDEVGGGGSSVHSTRPLHVFHSTGAVVAVPPMASKGTAAVHRGSGQPQQQHQQQQQPFGASPALSWGQQHQQYGGSMTPLTRKSSASLMFFEAPEGGL